MWGIKIPQRILGLKDDGNVGKLTLDTVNGANQKELHAKIVKARLDFVDHIIEADIIKVEAKLKKKLTEKEKIKLTNKRFEKGWKNRIADYKYED